MLGRRALNWRRRLFSSSMPARNRERVLRGVPARLPIKQTRARSRLRDGRLFPLPDLFEDRSDKTASKGQQCFRQSPLHASTGPFEQPLFRGPDHAPSGDYQTKMIDPNPAQWRAARRFLHCDSGERRSAFQCEEASAHLHDQLRLGLSPLIGAEGFHALFARAARLTASGNVTVSPGNLKQLATADSSMPEEVAVFAAFFALLSTFIGEKRGIDFEGRTASGLSRTAHGSPP